MRKAAIPILLLAVAGLLLATRGAGAQAGFETFVVSDVEVAALNGHATLADVGTDAGVLGAQCGGARPLGGPTIPIAAVTALDADAIRLRIFRQGGVTLTGVVFLNCAVTVETAAPAVARLRALAR
jgi:hypothetical protein